MTAEELAAKAAAEKAAAEKVAAEKAAAEKAAADEAERKLKDGDKPTEKEAKLLKEVMEKKAALKLATEKAEAAAARLAAFDGIDPAEIRKLLAEKKAAEEKALEAAGNWDALKRQMNEAHAKELGAKDAAVLDLQGNVKSLNATIADLTVGNKFGNSPFVTTEIALTPGKARALYGPHFEFVDGKVIGYDKPAGEKGRVQLVDGKGEPLSFEDAIRKIVEADADADSLIKSKMKAGAHSGTLKTGKPGVDDPANLTGREKIAAGLDARQKAAGRK